jgi:hypothetical protein
MPEPRFCQGFFEVFRAFNEAIFTVFFDVRYRLAPKNACHKLWWKNQKKEVSNGAVGKVFQHMFCHSEHIRCAQCKLREESRILLPPPLA